MKKLLALILFGLAPAAHANYYGPLSLSTTTKSVLYNISGSLQISSDTTQTSSPTVTVFGSTGGIKASEIDITTVSASVVDVATMNATTAIEANGASGTSLACPSGQFASGVSFDMGIATSVVGGCQTPAASILGSTQTWTGANTFSSSLTANGFSDFSGGSTDFNIVYSSVVITSRSQGSNTSSNGCNIAGSTITITASQNPLHVEATIIGDNGTDQDFSYVDFFANNVRYPAGNPIMGGTASGTNGIFNLSFTYTFLPGEFTPGSLVTFCLGAHASGGTWNIPTAEPGGILILKAYTQR